MIRLATQDKPFFPDGLKEKLEDIRELGFDALEADGDILLNRFDELEKAVADTHLQENSVSGGSRGRIGD